MRGSNMRTRSFHALAIGLQGIAWFACITQTRARVPHVVLGDITTYTCSGVMAVAIDTCAVIARAGANGAVVPLVAGGDTTSACTSSRIAGAVVCTGTVGHTRDQNSACPNLLIIFVAFCANRTTAGAMVCTWARGHTLA